MDELIDLATPLGSPLQFSVPQLHLKLKYRRIYADHDVLPASNPITNTLSAKGDNFGPH
jgi:hypothetical protein